MTITDTDLNKLLIKALKILRKNYSCPGEDGISYKVIKKECIYHLSVVKNMFVEVMNGVDRFSIPKATKIIDAHKKERVIYVYNIYDRIIQQCLKLLIHSTVKSKISEKVLSHKAGINLNMKIKELLYTSEDIESVLRIDIADFYSTINKEILFEMLLKIGVDKAIVSAIRASFFHCDKGVPAGNCLSPILSDFYLTPIDLLFERSYARFSDDMFFAMRFSDEVNVFTDKIVPVLVQLKLKVNDSKIEILKDKSIENIL